MKKICIKNLILSSLFFLIALALFTFLYIKINKNFKKINEFIIFYQEKEEQKNEINTLNATISEIENDLISLNSHFVFSSNISMFFEEIEDLASSLGAKAQVLSIKAPDVKDKNAFVEVNVSGSFESLYKFLLLLENSKYELNIVSVNFSKDFNQEKVVSGQSSNWTANFVIKIISFIQEEN